MSVFWHGTTSFNPGRQQIRLFQKCGANDLPTDGLGAD